MQTKYLQDLATLVSLCKRRGFIFQSSEIYGGLNSCWDYGPLGANLKLNVKLAWYRAMTRREDIVGLDAAILMHPTVWKASGHVDGFSDPLCDCKKCKNRFREDTAMVDGKVVCPRCGSTEVTESRQFNLMFKTHMGPVEEDSNVVYLRPETAQGIFVNFENVANSMRKKIPFGIAQIGKSFRNEITPGNFTFRTREFEQMEMQFFVKPGTDEEWFETWKKIRWDFYLHMGIRENKLRYSEHGPDELAHYAKAAFDVQYEFPFGWQELEGVHNRSDFDLSQHQKFSSKKLEYFDEAAKEKYIPYVIETAVGCDRLCLAILCDAYREEVTTDENGKEDVRVVMGFKPAFAPVKVAVLPLSRKEPLTKMASGLRDQLAQEWDVEYDETASIGKRYRRQDEIGTPLCVTVDFESAEDESVTVRHRDSMTQDRVKISGLKAYIAEKLMNF
ncbi:MAG: glycine--tRNA ligase [Bdellovibrionaceae bacterium]|nr:glycine--tRNA ligase [Bdellovibrionales bacterium]MCB9084387.1 glycine--tRNA ligase [Pseudobdellovibrionaceae bacterium]